MKYRLWEVRQKEFNALLKNLGFTNKMKKALTVRYESNCQLSRPSTAMLNDITEHGLMKAEKKLLKAHEEFSEVYGN